MTQFERMAPGSDFSFFFFFLLGKAYTYCYVFQLASAADSGAALK